MDELPVLDTNAFVTLDACSTVDARLRCTNPQCRDEGSSIIRGAASAIKMTFPCDVCGRPMVGAPKEPCHG